MTNYPSESSLVVNATQQQLSSSSFHSGVAIAPSQWEESKGGYDVAFDTVSRLELQYKAVYSEIKNRTFKRGDTQTAAKFPFNGEQAKTLLGRQVGPGIAFYALPVILDVSGLGSVLEATVFVDVVGLESLPKKPENFEEYTAFWVPMENSTPTFSRIYLKDGEKPHYSKPEAYDCIERTYLYTWPEIEALTSASNTGVPARLRGEQKPTRGYQRVQEFEGKLLKSHFPQSFISEKPLSDSGYRNLVREVVEKSIDVGTIIAEDKQREGDFPADLLEILNRHQYLLQPEFNRENRLRAVEAALAKSPSENSGELSIDSSALDPRQGSRYRQYRYLTSGRKADKLQIPIGFS